MSVLAHFLEDEGIATTLISLVAEHSLAVQPPRALWVPFELGRPLGAPQDADFQRRVLRDALALLTEDGPGPLHVEFPDEAAQSQPDPDWRSGLDLRQHLAAWETAKDAASVLHHEIAALAPAQAAFVDRYGKSAVGVSGLSIRDAATFLCDYGARKNPQSPIEGISPTLLVRYSADDLKSYYLEALNSDGNNPSAGQLLEWLWQRTALGAQLRKMRRFGLEQGDKREQLVLGRFLVAAVRGRLDDLALAEH